MKIFIGADHRGVEYKAEAIKVLESLGYEVEDLGAFDPEQSCDYPDKAEVVASKTVKTPDSRGILVCMSGIGQSIAANKIKGARAALCYNAEAAKLSREHNDANILVLSSKFVQPADIRKIVKIWLETPFEGGRHKRRVEKIHKLETN